MKGKLRIQQCKTRYWLRPVVDEWRMFVQVGVPQSQVLEELPAEFRKRASRGSLGYSTDQCPAMGCVQILRTLTQINTIPIDTWPKSLIQKEWTLLTTGGCWTMESFVKPLPCNTDGWLNTKSLKAVTPRARYSSRHQGSALSVSWVQYSYVSLCQPYLACYTVHHPWTVSVHPLHSWSAVSGKTPGSPSLQILLFLSLVGFFLPAI